MSYTNTQHDGTPPGTNDTLGRRHGVPREQSCHCVSRKVFFLLPEMGGCVCKRDRQKQRDRQIEKLVERDRERNRPTDRSIERARERTDKERD